MSVFVYGSLFECHAGVVRKEGGRREREGGRRGREGNTTGLLMFLVV